MRLLPLILSIFVLIHLTLCWHKCTELSVQQYLCNYTVSWNIGKHKCSQKPSNCFYDKTQSLCICKYLKICREDDPGKNSYRFLQLNYSISLQLDYDNKQGIFSLSNLATSYLQNITTLLNSSLIPTGLLVSYYTACDGPDITYPLIDSYHVLFNTTTNFTIDYNCDSVDSLYVQLLGKPFYNYFIYISEFYLYEYKGAYYIDQNYNNSIGYNNYGSMLEPETNSLSTSGGNFTCLSFNSTPDPPTFKDHCNKYISRSLFNGTTVLVVTYEYNDSDVSVSVSTYDQYTQVHVSSGVMVIDFYGAGIQNETSSIPPNITNYIHHYEHYLTSYYPSYYIYNFEFYHQIVFYNQNSYINETNYFTYDDSCTSKTIYDNGSLSYLTNEFCCVEWQIAGIVSTTSGPTTLSPTFSPTTVSPTSSPTTVSASSSPTTVSPTPNPTIIMKTCDNTTCTTSTVHPSQSTSQTFTTSIVHPRTNTCSNSWYQSPLASISIWIASVYALLFRSEKL